MDARLANADRTARCRNRAERKGSRARSRAIAFVVFVDHLATVKRGDRVPPRMRKSVSPKTISPSACATPEE